MTEYRSNKATFQRPEGDRIIEDNFIQLNLKQTLDNLLAEQSWADSDRNAITLFKSEGITVVLIAMHEGAELKPGGFDTQSAMSVHVLHGSLSYEISGKGGLAVAGELITLQKDSPYLFRAVDDTATCCLLTVASQSMEPDSRH